MLKDYVQEWADKRVEINKGSVFSVTDYEYYQWFDLTGFFNSEARGVLSEDDLDINGVYPIFDIKCINNEKMFLNIRIDLRFKEIEYYEVHLLQNVGKSIGSMAHQYQTNLAAVMGFKSIHLEARRSLSKDDFFWGYVAWAKFGYTMTLQSQKKFEAEIEGKKIGAKGRERQVTCLQTLIRYEPCYWEEYGDSWRGIFDLAKNSNNNRILKIYLLFPKRFSCRK